MCVAIGVRKLVRALAILAIALKLAYGQENVVSWKVLHARAAAAELSISSASAKAAQAERRSWAQDGQVANTGDAATPAGESIPAPDPSVGDSLQGIQAAVDMAVQFASGITAEHTFVVAAAGQATGDIVAKCQREHRVVLMPSAPKVVRRRLKKNTKAVFASVAISSRCRSTGATSASGLRPYFVGAIGAPRRNRRMWSRNSKLGKGLRMMLSNDTSCRRKASLFWLGMGLILRHQHGGRHPHCAADLSAAHEAAVSLAGNRRQQTAHNREHTHPTPNN